MGISTTDVILKKRLEEDAWLNLPKGFDPDLIFNPLTNMPSGIDDEIHLYIIWLMSHPEYFTLMTKYIFNIELTPMQFCILRTVWGKKFPMLIGSRGLSKCVKDAWITTNFGFTKIDNIIPKDFPNNIPYYPDNLCVLGERGFNLVEYAWKNAPQKTIKITTEHGYELEGTVDQKIRVIKNDKFEWVELQDITESDLVPIDLRGIESHDAEYEIESILNHSECEYISSDDLVVKISGDKAKYLQFLLTKTRTLSTRDSDKTIIHFRSTNKHDFYYSRISKIEFGFSETYDVHIPNDHSFIANGFISHNTFLLAVYCLLRLLLLPRRKIVVAGAAFRQSKFVFEYMETIWNNAPVLRDLVGSHGGPSKDIDMWRFRIFDSVASFIPIGPGGDKIRGLRANDVLGDEFSSISREVFETVIVGFGAVSSSPIDNMKQVAAEKAAKEMGVWKDDAKQAIFTNMPNQLVLSGTAYYSFNHFAHYWKIWHKIIESKGDSSKIAIAFGGEDKYDPSISHNDFAVIRIPYDLIPAGFMDAAQVARSRATFDAGTFEMEYLAIFSKDSNGFFKRTLIEACCVNHNTEFNTLPQGAELFSAVTVGNPDCQYVFGIDPASEVDNFAIVILEIHKSHRRIVHCWTINRKGFKERVKAGVVKENDYYQYCAGKIRELMKKFPTTKIAVDTQGGGYAILEALQNTHDGKYTPLLPMIDPNKPKDSDAQAGLHIIDLVNFSGADYTRDSNHGLRKDLEDKVLLFPYFDSITLAEADLREDTTLYDGLEDCVLDIEELKDELATIVVTETATGRQRWDTPDVKLSGGKKGRARKDRYSALLMANMLARSNKDIVPLTCTDGGGFANQYQKLSEGPLYVGPQWFTTKMNGLY